MDLVCITVDSHEPAELARFWSAALDGPEPQLGPGGNVATCDLPAAGLYLEFVRVPDRKEVKNRLHFECSAGPLDQFDTEYERLVELGARLVWPEAFAPAIVIHCRW